jgi:hypothetical protein
LTLIPRRADAATGESQAGGSDREAAKHAKSSGDERQIAFSRLSFAFFTPSPSD